jgi:hypothetical protein
MHEDILDLMPFYVAGSLNQAERTRLEVHLQTCLDCRMAAREWRKLGRAVQAEVATRPTKLPPLAPWITTGGRDQESLVNFNPNGAEKILEQPQGVIKMSEKKLDDSPLTPAGSLPSVEIPELPYPENEKPASPTGLTNLDNRRAPRRNSELALVAGLVVLVIAMFSVLLVTNAGTNPGAATQSLTAATVTPTRPPASLDLTYPGAVKLAYDAQAVKDFFGDDSSLTPDQLKNSTVWVYSTSDDYQMVIEAYRQKLTSAGYNATSPTDVPPDGINYLLLNKGSKVVLVASASPKGWQTLPELPPFDVIKNQLKPGQNLIIIFTYSGTVQDFDTPPTITPLLSPTTPLLSPTTGK